VAGPTCENARSPNFVRSRGRKSIDEVEDERSFLVPLSQTTNVVEAGSSERDLLAPID